MSRREYLLALCAGSGLFGVTESAAQEEIPPLRRTVNPVRSSKPTGLPFQARFTDVAKEAGLTSTIVFGGTTRYDYILEAAGCGIAFLDYDNDGWLDIFTLCGSRTVGAPSSSSTNRLYHNNRDGTFTDVTAKAGLERGGWAFGVTVGDFNNDGNEDLFISCYGQNVLYRNNGDGTFTDVTEAAGLLATGSRWSTGCTFVDYNRDGYLDLFVTHYVVFDPQVVHKAGADPDCNYKGVLVNCGPQGLPKEGVTLYRNRGDGTFEDVTLAAGIAGAKGYGLTAVAADFDNDGWPDLYVACDMTPSLLFRNRGDGTFAEEGIERGAAFNEDGREQAGMGVAVGDFNCDGNLDMFKTHFAGDTSVLWQGDDKGYFTDVTRSSAVGVESRYVCWGTGFADLDNDGWPDLFTVAGSVYPEVAEKYPEAPHRCPRFIFRNLGNGVFDELIGEAGPGVAAEHVSRGCAFGDFDNDGDIDVLIANMNEPPSLLRNDVSGGHHWLKVKLEGTKSNRSAIGARVIAHYAGRQQAQERMAQSSYLSSSDPRLHFGMGGAEKADLDIWWPSGRRDRFESVAANQLVLIREGEGIIGKVLFPPR